MDATLKETNIWRSVKKFWIEGLSDTEIFFDNLTVTSSYPAVNNWIVVKAEGLTPRQLSFAYMTIFMFSRKDAEGDALVALRDKVMNLLSDGYLDLYDTETGDDPWEKIGGILIEDISQSTTIPSPGPSRMRYVQTTLKWGAVWWM